MTQNFKSECTYHAQSKDNTDMYSLEHMRSRTEYSIQLSCVLYALKPEIKTIHKMILQFWAP